MRRHTYYTRTREERDRGWLYSKVLIGLLTFEIEIERRGDGRCRRDSLYASRSRACARRNRPSSCSPAAMKGSWKTRAPPPLNEHDDDPEWMTFASNEAASFIDLDTPSSPLTFARHRKDSFGLDEDDSARPPSSRKADIRIVTDDSSSEVRQMSVLPLIEQSHQLLSL